MELFWSHSPVPPVWNHEQIFWAKQVNKSFEQRKCANAKAINKNSGIKVLNKTNDNVEQKLSKKFISKICEQKYWTEDKTKSS